MAAAPDILELEAAVERFVPDGTQLYIGNFGAQLTPVYPRAGA